MTQTNTSNSDQQQDFEQSAVDVFKKWRQSTGEGGFINFQYWPAHHKVVIDIGTVKNGALVDNAKCFINASQFMAYLKADVEDRITHLYPNFFHAEKKMAGWATYGGSVVGGQTIARVFKVTYWADDVKSRDFKCAWFEGQAMGKGAIKPIYEKNLKDEHIKMTMAEIAELYDRMSMTIMAVKVYDRIEKLVFEDD